MRVNRGYSIGAVAVMRTSKAEADNRGVWATGACPSRFRRLPASWAPLGYGCALKSGPPPHVLWLIEENRLV